MLAIRSQCCSKGFGFLLFLSAILLSEVGTDESQPTIYCVKYNNSKTNNTLYEDFIVEGDVQTQRIISNVSCETTHPPERYCYAYWQNVTMENDIREIPLVLKGCWVYADVCQNRSECIARVVGKGSYFCCCDAPLCNARITLTPEPFKSLNGKLPIPDDILNDRRGSSTVKVILTSLLPLTIVAAIIIVVFLLWRLCKSRFRGESMSSTVSIESKEAPLLPSRSSPTPSMDMAAILKQIQLLEVKATRRFGGCVRRAKLENEVVAVKIFHAQEKQSWDKERDLYTLTSLKYGHKNILKFIGALKHDIIDGGSKCFEYWLITEYQELGCLHDFLKSQTVSWSQAIPIILSSGNGLVFLHSRRYDEMKDADMTGKKLPIAHRDIKSRNILLKRDMTACIADFGLAMVLDGKTGNTHSQVGTLRYMSPEVLDGSINFSDESFLKIDVYAFALVIWEVLSRTNAFGVGAAPDYKLPFEEKVGLNVSLEEMKQAVVDEHLRPSTRKEWAGHEGMSHVSDILDEMWDQDPDARLSAITVHHRLYPLTVNNLDEPVSTHPPVFLYNIDKSLASDSKSISSTPLRDVNLSQTDNLSSPKSRIDLVANSLKNVEEQETNPSFNPNMLSIDTEDDYLVPPFSFSKANQIFIGNYPYVPASSPVINGCLNNSPGNQSRPEKSYDCQMYPYPMKNLYNAYYPPNVTPPMEGSYDGKHHASSQFTYVLNSEMTPLINSSVDRDSSAINNDFPEVLIMNRSNESNHVASLSGPTN